MPHNDLEYLRRRAADEASSALTATTPRAAELHSELAEGYAKAIERQSGSVNDGDPRNAPIEGSANA